MSEERDSGPGGLLAALRLLFASVTVAPVRGSIARSSALERLHHYPDGDGGMRGEILTVVSWNLQKGMGAGFRDEFARLIEEEEPDLLLCQEARLGMYSGDRLGGEFARAWRVPFTGVLNGVATLSVAPPARATHVHSERREAYVATAKVSLVTEHLLATGDSLLVINVHGLNFDLTGSLYAGQMHGLLHRVAEHQGPMILAGDLNTWSERRLAVVRRVAEALGLREVVPDNGVGRTASSRALAPLVPFGLDRTMALDRMFCRGIEPIDCRFDTTYSSSDHVPIVARFRLSS